MSIKAGLLTICAAVLILISGSLYVVSLAVQTQADIARAEARRYHSYQLADGLRQSSDDLTRMARLYVVTGDPRYRQYFDEILAIRDGQAPRPFDYGNIYWDLVIGWGKPPRRAGAAVSLEQLMREARFTPDELALLEEAKHRSDALVALESRAMNTVQGRFPDREGHFTVVGPPNMELARSLLHGSDYHRAKVEIMVPIHDFYNRVESRTGAEVMHLRRRGERLNVVIIFGLGTAVILVLVSFVLIARYPFLGVVQGPAPRSVERPLRPRGVAIWTVWPLVVAAVVACVLVLCLSWWLHESIEDKVRASVRNALEAVHQSTTRAIDDWLGGLDQEIRAWARSALLRDVLARSPTSSGGGDAELLAPLKNVPSLAGYLVVDARGQVVASDDAGRIGRAVDRGVRDALATELHRLPDHSVIMFPDGSRPDWHEDPAFRRDILMASEVPDARGSGGGMLVFRFDPRRDLSRMLQRGRLGESGDTYVFDRAGWIVSESRFRDPREDVTSTGSATSRRERPLTRMTLEALAGRSGVDLYGYRDYRGAAVVGAWTWNERYGIGIATEVGLDEAYGVLGDYQRQTRLSTGLSLLLIVGLSGMFAWNRLALRAASAKLETAYEVIRGHMDRVEEELAVARDLQLSMVPHVFPAWPDRAGASVYATLRPAREVGGDFYDFYFIDDTHLFFCVGDVSDKGVPAALFMAVAKTLIRTRSNQEPSTGRLVSYVNAELYRDNAKCMFVTLFVGRLDMTTGELVYTSAGHEPPYLREAGGALRRLAERHGPMVGAAPGVVYRESGCRLGPGDLLVVYTDGVSEATNVHGAFFSEERIAEIVQADASASAADVIDRLLTAVDGFAAAAEPADDITVLALRVPSAGEDAALAESVVLRNRLSDLSILDDVLDRFGQRGALSQATVSELRIVCDEILGNLIAYAYPHGGEHDIDLRLQMTGSRLVVTVSDDGVPFNPLAVAAPDTSRPLAEREVGGLGIHLVRSLVDDMRYRREDARNETTLVIDVGSRVNRPGEDARVPRFHGGPGERAQRLEGDDDMEIHTRRVNDVLVVDLVGRLESRTAGPASTELNKIAEGGVRKVLLNAGRLEYVSSAGLRAIMVAAKLLQVNGGSVLICGANATVKRVMEVSGFSSLLRLYDTESEGLAAFA
jgi:sigma-B regulation protein RsbU (phosphoserine phosphatase)